MSKRDTATASETYRCQSCGVESPVKEWGKGGIVCPRCGAEFEAGGSMEAVAKAGRLKCHCAFCGKSFRVDAGFNSQSHLEAAMEHTRNCAANPFSDLLEACRAALHRMTEDGYQVNHTGGDVLVKLRKAIAKAEGASHE